MPRANVSDLIAFIAVARDGSFTKAAARFGVSQSALSHTIRQLEERLGVRLLTRTTRAVSLTAAGERLLSGVAYHFDEIDAQVEALGDLRDRPSGEIRIVASDYAIDHLLWPKLVPFLREYPEIKVELCLDNGLTDIVTQRFDAGVRMGEHLAKDMISARLSPSVRMAVVGSAAYFDAQPIPAHPKELIGHRCITFRSPSSGGVYVWEFEEEGHDLKVRVDGQLTFNTTGNQLRAVRDGFGLAYMPEEYVAAGVADGSLVRVLADFCPRWEGFYLYYPHRRQSSPAFSALVTALRHRD